MEAQAIAWQGSFLFLFLINLLVYFLFLAALGVFFGFFFWINS